MKLFPAIDLKDGKCVRLSEGKQETSVVYNTNPLAQAKFFEDEGCERIHIVDLDAAFGNSANNRSVILDIRKTISIDIELGGGIRTEEDVSFWLDNGINFLIIGSMAINDSKNFKKIINSFPGKLYVSLDDFNGKIMIYGWVKESFYTTKEIINIFNNTKIKGFVFTDTSRDGMLKGINITKIKSCLQLSKKPLIVGGGLSSIVDLKNLLKLNDSLLEGVIAGKSFYQGKIDLKTAHRTLL